MFNQTETHPHVSANRVSVYVSSQLSYLEVANGNPGKHARHRPIFIGHQVSNDVHSVQMKIGSQEQVQEDELDEHVARVDKLRTVDSSRERLLGRTGQASENILTLMQR